MTSTNIALVLISGLGALHGLFLAILLWTQSKRNASHKILAAMLIVLSFRIAKSVFLEFTPHLDVKLIFTGLATLTAIGPLFYFYTRSLTEKSFVLSKQYLFHFLPMFFGVCFGCWISDENLRSLPMWFFVLLFAGYYGHYLLYLMVSYFHISTHKQAGHNPNTNKLLRLLLFGLLSIWTVYVLNLFDEFVPYIVGPILYTLIAYSISIIVARKGYLTFHKEDKYKTTSIAPDQAKEIFNRVTKAIKDDKQYKNADLTLRSLSAQLNLTTQTLSMVINQESQSNFNSYVNHFRIDEAIRLFQRKEYQRHTIAAIAFEVGFNSLTSFNSAFKKKTSKTPLTYRNELSK